MKNLFITGSGGKDGNILTKLLKKKSNINIYLLAEKKKVNRSLKNTFLINLKKKKEIDTLFGKYTPDFVLHLGSKNPSFKEKNIQKFYTENLISTKDIFLSTFKYNLKAKFVFANSSQIFKNKNGLVDENSKILISSDYTRFRIESHRYMMKYKKKYKLNYSNIILFNHDSIHRNPKFLIPRIVKALIKKNKKFMNFIIKKNIKADFSHAEDICNALVKILINNKNYDNIILSSGKLTSINEIIKNIIKKRNININIDLKKNEINDLNDLNDLNGLIGDNTLAKKKFNWKIKKNIFEASLEIYDFYLKQLRSRKIIKIK